VTRRHIGDEEIVMRCVYALINEGARILQEGIAVRASDIDVIYLLGYGFPPARGGPMYYADRIGLPLIVQAMQDFAVSDANFWSPAPLLTRLAAAGKSFGA
jgi:3-hydroxyacyl-CoA dehydrogenase